MYEECYACGKGFNCTEEDIETFKVLVNTEEGKCDPKYLCPECTAKGEWEECGICFKLEKVENMDETEYDGLICQQCAENYSHLITDEEE